LSHKSAYKHYLDIVGVESKKSTHFSIITNDRPYSFVTTGDAGNFSSVRQNHLLAIICNVLYVIISISVVFILQNADVILTDLASAIKQIFPTVPLKYIIRKVNIDNKLE